MKILTPENTIRRSKQETGFRFIEVCDEYELSYTVYEVGEYIKDANAYKLIPLAVWHEGEAGPSEYRHLQVRYNNFIPYPRFIN